MTGLEAAPQQALAWLLAGTPFVAAALLLASKEPRSGAWVNVAAAGVTLLFALLLAGALLPGGPSGRPAAPMAGGVLRADALAVWAALPTAIVGLSTAWHARACLSADVVLRRFAASRARLLHAGFQLAQGFVLLALLAGSMGLAWLGMLGAGLVLAGTPALHGTPAAIAATRHAFLLAAAGLAPALLGTAVLALSAQAVLAGWDVGWVRLTEGGGGALPQLGFALLLVGYGSLAGLGPLAPPLPGAGLAGTEGLPAILATGLSNAALLLLLRTRAALGPDAAASGALNGAGLMVLLGAASVVLGAAALWRRPGHADAGRWLGAAGAVQVGAVALAFALGGPAVEAGLVYLAAATLARTAAAQCLGRATQRRGGAELGMLAGLHDVGRGVGVLLLLCLAASAGLPPAGVSTGQILLGMEAARHSPALALVLVGAFLVAGWSLLAGGARLAFGGAAESRADGTGVEGALPSARRTSQPSGPPPGRWDLVGVWGHLVLLLLLGLLLPAPVAALIGQAAASVR